MSWLVSLPRLPELTSGTSGDGRIMLALLAGVCFPRVLSRDFCFLVKVVLNIRPYNS